MDALLAAVINSSPAPDKPEGLTAEKTLEFAEEMLAHFGSLEKAYHAGDGSYIRIDEVTSYLSIWEQVKEVQGDWDQLSKLAKNEVLDHWYESIE